MNLEVEIIGFLASWCLVLSGVPQLVKVINEGHCDGLNIMFLCLLILGFLGMLAYVMLTTMQLPLILNYAFNAIVMLTMMKYKIFPQNKKKIIND